MVMKSLPQVSVIIPAYYSSPTIAISLGALRKQTFRDFEVIVVNSSPEKKTEKIVRDGFPEVVFIQSLVRLLPHAARNLGVSRARGEFLVFSDPDCLADPHWLAALMDGFRGGARVLVGSMGLAGAGWLQTGIHLCKFHWLLPGLKNMPKTCAPTANAAYSRALWDRIGPFPGDWFAGDGILSRRAAREGCRPIFISDAVVFHFHNEGIREFLAQRFARGSEYAEVQLSGFLENKVTPVTRLRLLVSWSSAGWVMARAGWNSVRTGWGISYCLTFFLQLAGHLAWSCGESFRAGSLSLKRWRPMGRKA